MNKKSITLRLDTVSKIILFILGAGVWFVALKPIGSSEVNAESNQVTKENTQARRSYLPPELDYLQRIANSASSIDRKLIDISGSLSHIQDFGLPDNGKLSSILYEVKDIRQHITYPFSRPSDSTSQSDFPSSFDYLASQRAKASKPQKQKTPTEPSTPAPQNDD
jgi:hypothetical protein